MGLDHALLKSTTYIDMRADDTDPVDDDQPKIEMTNVITWRKENWLHAWFVDHVNDGNDEGYWYANVNLEQLAGLLTTIRQTLVNGEASLLPPRAGFFFGSTEVGQHYWESLAHEAQEIQRVIDEEKAHVAAGGEPHHFYYWCWW